MKKKLSKKEFRKAIKELLVSSRDKVLQEIKEEAQEARKIYLEQENKLMETFSPEQKGLYCDMLQARFYYALKDTTWQDIKKKFDVED